MKRKLTAALAAVLLLAMTGVQAVAQTPAQDQPVTSPQIVGVDEYTEDIYLVEYEEIASNEQSILYADVKRGFFALKNRASGDIWYSTPNDILLDDMTIGMSKWALYSQLTVNYLYIEDIMSAVGTETTNSQLSCIEEGSVTVTVLDDGIRVSYYFGDLGATIPVEYRLDGASLVASIALDDIDEGDKCVITSINLLPSFGAGNSEEEGSLFVPDGCGALIHFNNGINRKPYEEMIYGDNLVETPELDSTQKEDIRLPVFATLKQNSALMGVVTQGDGSAAIRAVNGHDECGYNAVSSVCVLRDFEQLIMFKTNPANRRDIGRVSQLPDGATTYEVVYTPLSGEDADYVHVAHTYRQYLIKEKGLTAQIEKPALLMDMVGSIDTKAAFLGIEYTKNVKLTTFNQAQTILNEWDALSDVPVSVRYLGWSNSGLLNKKLPTKASALSSLGGKKGFAALSNLLSGQGSTLFADVDLLRFRAGSDKYAIKNSFNVTVEHTERLRSVFATKLDLDPIMLLTPQRLSTMAEKYLTSVKKNGITHLSLSTLGDMIYSNNSQNDPFHRYYFVAESEKLLKSYADSGITLAVDGGNAYTLPYVSRVYNAPTVTSGCDVFDEEIPFYQIVLHGYMSISSTPMTQAMEQDVNVLKTVESGSELLYTTMYTASSAVMNTRYDYLYGTQYSLWLEDAAEIAARYYALQQSTYDQPIVDHRTLQTDVMLTEYADGTQVIVNYTDTDVTVEGITVAAMDYAVKR